MVYDKQHNSTVHYSVIINFWKKSYMHTPGLVQYNLKPFKGWIFQREHNIYVHYMSLLHNDMTHALKILPQVRLEPTYST